MEWLRRSSAPQAATLEERALEPIRLYSAAEVLVGFVDTAGERLSDILQSGRELRVLPSTADPGDARSWLSVNRDLLLFVVPPPHVSRPEMRLHRHRQQVLIRVGPYVVSGTAHLLPGLEQDAFARARQPFLPLTDALIERDGATPEQAEVVIVNLAFMEEFREL